MVYLAGEGQIPQVLHMWHPTEELMKDLPQNSITPGVTTTAGVARTRLSQLYLSTPWRRGRKTFQNHAKRETSTPRTVLEIAVLK